MDYRYEPEPYRDEDRDDEDRELCELCGCGFVWCYAVGLDGFVWRLCYECALSAEDEDSGFAILV